MEKGKKIKIKPAIAAMTVVGFNAWVDPNRPEL